MRSWRKLLPVALLLVLGGTCLAAAAQEAGEAKKKPKGPYLGQTPPGRTPVIFSPGFASKPGPAEYGCSLTPDGAEFYFSRESNTWYTVLQPNGWTKPKRAPWNAPSDDYEPHVAADGSKLWFSSSRTSPDGPVFSGIWVMERAGSGWGAPVYHGPGMFPSTARNGNLYVTDTRDPDNPRIALQRFEEGAYGPLEPLGDEVNDTLPSAHPCIAWDEGFLIFDSPRPGTFGDPWHFYICFRMPDGSWSPAARIEETGQANCPSLSPDGKYLFFSRDGDLWWVSAEILEKYRPAPATKVKP